MNSGVCPLGIGLTKMIPLKGGKAMTLIGQYYYNVVRPELGPAIIQVPD